MFNKKAVKFIESQLGTKYPKIEVKPGKCRWNFRCHLNAVHEAINNKDKKIAMVFYREGSGEPSIHFLNVDSKGRYTDNTIGNWATYYDYYLVDYIDKKDFSRVSNLFQDFRDEIQKSLPLFTRIFNNVIF